MEKDKVIENLFDEFIEAISINKDKISDISISYKNITKILNYEFYKSHSDSKNSYQHGSYGRRTAIFSTSDLDMLYVLPNEYKKELPKNEPQRFLLCTIKNVLTSSFPRTNIKIDRSVVIVPFKKFKIEILPAFLENDGSYTYPDTYDGGKWKSTYSLEEKEAFINFLNLHSPLLKNYCRIVRAWKNHHGIKLSGYLIDILIYNFYLQNKKLFTDGKIYSYLTISKYFFTFLKALNENGYYQSPLNKIKFINIKINFFSKINLSLTKIDESIDSVNIKKASNLLKEVYGKHFPTVNLYSEEAAKFNQWRDTEEFIEDLYPVDIISSVIIDCKVSQDGFRTFTLLTTLLKKLPLFAKKRLEFFISFCDVTEPYDVRWKVRNVGREAEKRDMIRGQIIDGTTRNTLHEKTDFKGDHYVECYIIKDGIVVARDRIIVPIYNNREDN